MHKIAEKTNKNGKIQVGIEHGAKTCHNRNCERSERTMTKKRKMRTLKIFCAAILISLAVFLVRAFAFSPNTCGGSDAQLEEFLEDRSTWSVELLKTEQKGRIKAVIYEREDLGICISIFQRKLFGLRWEYDGIDMLTGDGLQMTGSWLNNGANGTKCEVTIWGDNRDGRVASYTLNGADSVSRENLEADFIADIYILDGIGSLPDREELVQQVR